MGDCKPIVLASSAFCIHGIKGYHSPARTIGQSFFWEQQHLLQYLGIPGNARVEFRKGQLKRDRLGTVCEDWGLHNDNFLTGIKSMGDTVVLSTALATPWLFAMLFKSGGRHIPQGRHILLKQVVDSFASLAKRGIDLYSLKSALQVLNPDDAILGEVAFRGGDPVRPGRDLLSLYPELNCMFEHVREWLAADTVWSLPAAIEEASLLDWVLFACLPHADRRLVPRHRVLVRQLRIATLDRLAAGIEIWMLLGYCPTMTGHELVLPLHRKNGRQRMDSWTKAQALFRARSAHGSSSTFLEGATCDRHLDDAVTRAICNVYLDKLQALHSQHRRWSIAWGPASYSGHQYNLGLAFSADTGKAMPLPAKVFHSKNLREQQRGSLGFKA